MCSVGPGQGTATEHGLYYETLQDAWRSLHGLLASQGLTDFESQFANELTGRSEGWFARESESTPKKGSDS